MGRHPVGGAAARPAGAAGRAPLTIQLYLLRELGRPLGAIGGILVALFASYTAAGFLDNAVDGLLPPGLIAALVGLKLLISLEVLIPASLYASVLLTLSRLHGDSEIAAMGALRMGPGTLRRAVLIVAGALALVAGALSLFVRPFAYRELHHLAAEAASVLDTGAMEAGAFYVSENGDRAIFLRHRAGRDAPARDVFVRLQRPDGTRIVHARLADAMLDRALAGEPDVVLTDAHVVTIDRPDGRPDESVDAASMVIDPDRSDASPTAYSAVAAGTARLARSHSLPDVAELEWRFSTPVSTLLLGLLAIPLSRARPRGGRGARLGVAMGLYFGYYLVCTIARTSVQHGVVGRFPGVWWAPLVLAGVLLAASVRPARFA